MRAHFAYIGRIKLRVLDILKANATEEAPGAENLRGFTLPDEFVESVYWPWVNSGRQMLPTGGSWFVQDKELMDNLHAYDALVDWGQEVLTPPEEKERRNKVMK